MISSTITNGQEAPMFKLTGFIAGLFSTTLVMMTLAGI